MRTHIGLGIGLLALAFLAAPLRARAEDAQEQFDKYFELAMDGKDAAGAKKIGEAFLVTAAKDADMLNEFAWQLLTKDGIEKRDMELAMKVAKAAYDACEGKSAAIVDTYARAFFDTGKTEEAIKLQKKALELCDDDNLKNELEETLKRYEKKAAEKK